MVTAVFVKVVINLQRKMLWKTTVLPLHLINCCDANLLTYDADILNVEILFVTKINTLHSNTCKSVFILP